MFQIFDLQKVDGHVVQFLQLGHSLANIKIYKSRSIHFCASSNRFRDNSVSNCLTLKSMSRSWSTIFAMRLFDGKCQNLQTSKENYFRQCMACENDCNRQTHTETYTQTARYRKRKTDKAIVKGEIADLSKNDEQRMVRIGTVNNRTIVVGWRF